MTAYCTRCPTTWRGACSHAIGPGSLTATNCGKIRSLICRRCHAPSKMEVSHDDPLSVSDTGRVAVRRCRVVLRLLPTDPAVSGVVVPVAVHLHDRRLSWLPRR